jgi:hypothetical protein
VVDISAPDETRESLPEFLTRRARRSSDRRLVIDAAVGVLLAAAMLLWRPPFWIPLLGAALTIGAFGAWGITDRELTDRVARPGSRTAPLRAARATTAVVGGAGALTALLSAFMTLLGTWIS